MAFVIADRVQETTTTTGTGSVTLLGAALGFQSFAAIGNGNTTYYTISDQGGANWEVGLGTYSTTGPTLARTTVLASSNSGSLVNFAAGTKSVFVTYPAEKSVNLDSSGNVSALGTIVSGTWQATTIAAGYGGTGLTSPGTSGNVLTSNGTSWVSQAPSGAGTITTTDFTATAGQTTFTASYTVGLVQVFRNGVKLAATDYTATNGTSVVLATGANAGDIVQVVAYSSLNLYSTITTDTFSGNGSTTAFTMTNVPANAASALVAISGVVQDPSTYTVASTTLTFSTAPPTGTNNISVRYLGVPSSTTVSSFSAGTTGLTPSTATSGAVTLAGTLATTNGGTGLTGFTAGNNAIYSTSSSALTAGTLPVAAGGTGNTTGQAASVANALTIGTGLRLSSGTTYNGSAALTLISNGTTLNSQTSAYVVAATDAGKLISITTGGVTVNNSVMSAGDIVSIYNNSGSSQTITQGAGVTLQWAGQTASTTGNRTLGLYGMATIVFLSASSAVITGSGLT